MDNYGYENGGEQIELIECHFCKRHTPKFRARSTTIISSGGEEVEVLTCRNCNIIAHNVPYNNVFIIRALCSVTRLIWEKTTRDSEKIIKVFQDLYGR